MRNQKTRARRVRLLLPALATLTLGGCSSTGPGSTIESEVRFYRAQWEATGPASYVYALRHTCFCSPEAIGPVRVTVDESSVTARVYVDSSEPVDPDFHGSFPDIDGLFDVLEDAIEREAHQIDVTWHESDGYPVSIFVDYIEFAADEERGFTVTELPN